MRIENQAIKHNSTLFLGSKLQKISKICVFRNFNAIFNLVCKIYTNKIYYWLWLFDTINGLMGFIKNTIPLTI